MKKNLLFLIIIIGFSSTVSAQKYSVRTNILNLVAKGPSISFSNNIAEHKEFLVTYALGNFHPFFFEDSYKYSTLNAEYRWKGRSLSKLQFYRGAYVRYIHKRILTEGYDAGPYGIFSKAPRNFTANGLSAGLTSGAEWSLNSRWLIDFNTLLGAGKYISQVDYAGHNKINYFFDTRIALEVGFRF